MKDRLFDLLMPLIPKNEMSHLVGRLVNKPLPGPLGRQSVRWFQRHFDLFIRKLKSGVRPIGEGEVVHPADAHITEAGTIEGLTAIQAKGHSYKIPELLRSSHFSPRFDGGTFFTYYLCPTDYHRVHAPVDGKIIWSAHVPGLLWPVNHWSVNAISGLFTLNERVVVIIETPRGLAALVMVAATNVGNMSMSFDQNISTRIREPERHVREHSYKPEIAIRKGEEVGIFHMGSTVIMLYEKGVLNAEPEYFKNRHVKMGQSLTDF